MPLKSLIPFSAPSRLASDPVYPALALIRALSALHILLAALYPTVSFLYLTAPIQIPFLVFLSAFSLVLTARPIPYAPFTPHPFYLRRFICIAPFFILFTFLHAFLFSTSSRPFLRALLSSLFLSPYLPSYLTFPSDDLPFFAAGLLPSLAAAYLVYPVLLHLLPHPNTPHRSHISAALFVTFFTTFLQAFWFTVVPTISNGRHLSLLDLFAFFPSLSHLPAFCSGAASAIAYLSLPPTFSSPPIRVLRFLAAVSTLVVAVFAVYPFLPKLSTNFLSVWIRTGMLLPLLAITAACAAALSDAPSHPHRSATYDRWTQRITLHTTRFIFAYYLTAPLLYRSLSKAACSFTINSSICLTPFVDADIYSYSDNFFAEAAKRALSIDTFWGPRIPPPLFILLSVPITSAFYLALFLPTRVYLLSVVDRFLRAVWQPTEPSSWFILWSRRTFFDRPVPKRPLRDAPRSVKLLRVVGFYLVSFLFFAVVFILSGPFLWPYTEDHNRYLCNLFPMWSYCQESDDLNNKHVSMDGILRVIRWMALITLPPTFVNLVGQIMFPRVWWKSLPHISDMLALRRDPESATMGPNETTSGDQSPTSVMGKRSEGMNGRAVGGSMIVELSNEMCLDFRIFIRYVTRGHNRTLVIGNAKRAANVMMACGLPREMWRIEIVTDKKLHMGEEGVEHNTEELVVPATYATPSGALYKARALNYAIEESSAGKRDWIVHLDEETQFDRECVRGILAHCGREAHSTFVRKRQKWPRIGQGPIQYAGWLSDDAEAGESGAESANWMTSLADSGRVSDDCGRYRLQFEIGDAAIGIHGSYVVVCNCVERAVTFDHGMEGSIAEDAYFSMVARTKGVKFGWIDAMMSERSPMTLTDFVKQRARWLVGGILVVRCERLPLRTRWLMGVLTGVWTMTPMSYTVIMVTMVLGGGGGEGWLANMFYEVAMPLLTVLGLWNYGLGFCVTFGMREVGVVRFLVLLYVQLILAPVFGTMEVLSVAYALWNFARVSKGFHVVQKEARDVSDGSDVTQRRPRETLEMPDPPAATDERSPLLAPPNVGHNVIML